MVIDPIENRDIFQKVGKGIASLSDDTSLREWLACSISETEDLIMTGKADEFQQREIGALQTLKDILYFIETAPNRARSLVDAELHARSATKTPGTGFGPSAHTPPRDLPLF